MYLSETERDLLEQKAFRIRKHIIETIVTNGEGHGGPALSCTDILAVLYFHAMNNLDPKNPKNPDRDYFMLSAGHKCLALYGTLVEAGFEDEAVLKTYNELGSPVPGHPDMKKFKGVDFSSGSLGHGFCISLGIAKALKIQNAPNKVYAVMGDGEQMEGSVWEGASFAAHHGLDNVVAFVDRNGLQINGTTEQVASTAPLEERYKAFGWHVQTVDGHDVDAIAAAIDVAHKTAGKPSMIVCNTVKGKGLSFAENNVGYHHWHPGKEESDKALAELAVLGSRWNA